MATLTLRIPDDKHERLRQLAAHRHQSVNKLLEELATVSLAQFDSENRFRAMAVKGDRDRGLELLDKLDSHFAEEED